MPEPARSGLVTAANPFQAELHLHAKPSRLLLGFIASSHLLAGVAVWAMPLAAGWQAGLLLAVLVSVLYYGGLHSGYLPQRSVQLAIWREFGGWELQTHSGESLPAQLCGSSFSSYYLSVLNFKTRQGRRFTLVLLPDNLDAASGQHLRRRLWLDRAASVPQQIQ